MANPPFQHPARNQQNVAQSATTASAPLVGPFEGGRQPYAPRKLPPSLLSVDTPPAYAWELLVLPAEDPTAYFRAQRWPQQKIIVSVDNPPAQDDGRAVAMQVITSIWNAPIIPLPQLPRKIDATIVQVSSATGDLFSLGVGTATFVGQSGTQADWSATALGTAAFVGAAQDTAAWLSTAIGTAQFTGAALDTGAWSSTGAATATWNGAALSQAAWTAVATGTASFNEVSTNTADWFSGGIATAIFVGAQPAAFAGDIASTGVGTMLVQGTSVATGDMSSAGSATVRFFGSTGARVTNRDGWRVRAQQAERRRRKDEEEIMAIAKAVLPLLRRGIRQSTRISL